MVLHYRKIDVTDEEWNDLSVPPLWRRCKAYPCPAVQLGGFGRMGWH